MDHSINTNTYNATLQKTKTDDFFPTMNEAAREQNNDRKKKKKKLAVRCSLPEIR